MSEARIRHLPYVIQRTEDGKYRVLNRRYKPPGLPNKLVRSEDYPVAVQFKGLGASTAAKISYKGSTDLDAI